jgi:hypothetical protein
LSQTLIVQKRRPKICPMCLNEFDIGRITQVCCSRKCFNERRSLKNKLKRKEQKEQPPRTIEINCMYAGCKEKIIRTGHASNRKYCDVHAKIRHDERRRESSRRMYLKRTRGLARPCIHCGKEMTIFQRKFCSLKCCNEVTAQKKLRQNFDKRMAYHIRLIKHHSEKIRQLKEKVA